MSLVGIATSSQGTSRSDRILSQACDKTKIEVGCQMMLLSLFLLVSLAALANAQEIISTFAGSGAASFSGDGGPASSASFNRPVYVRLDASGVLYVADENNQRVRRIDPGTGIVTTFAGNGTRGFFGDGGPATAASLSGVNGVCSDTAGNIYLNDTGNNRIRRVDASGTITTFAGNGTAASINAAFGIAVDSTGAVYLADTLNNRIRRVSPLAPGFIGLYQVNFRVPAASRTGSVDAVVSVGGLNSNTSKIVLR